MRHVCDFYICPTTGETESACCGGFDNCCDHPRCPGNRGGSRYHTGETVPAPGGGLGYNGRTTKDALSQRELTQGYDHFQLRNQ